MIIELPTGEVVEFPDTMPMPQIQEVLRKQFPTPQNSPTMASADRTLGPDSPPVPGPPSLGQRALRTGLPMLGKALEVANIPFKPLDVAGDVAERGLEKMAPGITKDIEVPMESMMAPGMGMPVSGETIMAPGAGKTAVEAAKLAALGPYARALGGATKGALGALAPAAKNIAGLPQALQYATAKKGIPGLTKVEELPPVMYQGGVNLDVPPALRGVTTAEKVAPPKMAGPVQRDELGNIVTPPTEAAAEPPLTTGESDIEASANALLKSLYGGAEAAVGPTAGRVEEGAKNVEAIPKPPGAFRPEPSMQALQAGQQAAGRQQFAETMPRFAAPSSLQPPAAVPRERWGTESARLKRQIQDIQRLGAIIGSFK